jgi:hypothetical protein
MVPMRPLICMLGPWRPPQGRGAPCPNGNFGLQHRPVTIFAKTVCAREMRTYKPWERYRIPKWTYGA